MAAEIFDNNHFSLASLRGGLDDSPAIMTLADDACTVAENVEFVSSTLGERRKGCEAITLSANITAGNREAVTWMHRHLPTNNEAEAELWVFSQDFAGTVPNFEYKDIAGWNNVIPAASPDCADGRGHRIQAQSLHGKLFFAYDSSVNRLHVWDGTDLRWVGIAAPLTAPGVADQGAGTLTTQRYYRVRFITLDGSVIVARSEPSAEVSITPSGAGASIRVTINAGTMGAENHVTHWEAEASLDGVTFYRIATIAIGTTTYDDSTPASPGYAIAGNELSADIGDHTVPPSAKFLSVDADRLLMGGSWEDPALASRVTWTPVYADPGDGNDERIELDQDPFIDLDGFEGGEITGMSRAVNGYIFVFKRGHIYRLVRTNQRASAYEATCITKARGALPGSLVEAINQEGQPSLYFLDPSVGPTRLSSNGLQWCGRDIQTLWRRVNVNALVPCHGVYYANKRQLHYWIAVDDSDYPNMKIVLHLTEMRDTDEGGRRGWVTVSKDSRIATAHCSVMFSDNVDDSADRSLNLVPLIGKQKWQVGVNTREDIVQMCDTGGTDAHTTGDTLSAYRGVVTSRPFALSGLLDQHAILSGALLINASSTPDGIVFVKAIRDFGAEDKTVEVYFYTPGDESHLIVKLDNLTFSELYALQISLGDLDDNVTPPETWGMDMLQLRVTSGNRA